MENVGLLLVITLAVFLFAGEPDLTDALIDHLTCEAPE